MRCRPAADTHYARLTVVRRDRADVYCWRLEDLYEFAPVATLVRGAMQLVGRRR